MAESNRAAKPEGEWEGVREIQELTTTNMVFQKHLVKNRNTPVEERGFTRRIASIKLVGPVLDRLNVVLAKRVEIKEPKEWRKCHCCTTQFRQLTKNLPQKQ